MNIQLLNKKLHVRKNFDCNIPELNQYLSKTASQHDKADLSRTYIFTKNKDDTVIQGFYTLSTCHIIWSEIPDSLQKKYPRNGITAALIGRLAIDKTKQNQGLGSLLVIDAIAKIVNSTVPCPVIIVDSKNDKAKQFYLKLGFEELSPQNSRLFMSTKYAKEMLDEAA